MSVLLCLANIVESILVFATLPKEDSLFNKKESMPEDLKEIAITNAIHCVLYVALVLLTICAYIQIMTGLKVTYTENCYNMSQMQQELNRTIRARNWLFIFCGFLLLTDILLVVFGMVDSIPLNPEAALIYYLALLPVLSILYITIVCIIFSYMNSAYNP